MNKFILYLSLVSLMAATITTAHATTFTFQSNDSTGNKADMMDLEHGYYYGWSIIDNNASALGKELLNGATIKSASLVYSNIYNWVPETSDQLNSFLLADPPPLSNKSEIVPVTINGVPQGHNLYTYTKSTTSTSTVTNKIEPSKYTPPAGYVLVKSVKNGVKYTHTISKTTVSTKTGVKPNAPSGYTVDTSKTKFIQDTITLNAGVSLSNNLWERADQQSIVDIDWGTENFRIQDINDTPNPWHDPIGGHATGFDLVYNFDEDTINKLFEYALNGSFGIGIDPDCHYYNNGITFTIETAPVPEPGTLMLLGLGMLGLAIYGKRRVNK